MKNGPNVSDSPPAGRPSLCGVRWFSAAEKLPAPGSGRRRLGRPEARRGPWGLGMGRSSFLRLPPFCRNTHKESRDFSGFVSNKNTTAEVFGYFVLGKPL